MSGYGEAGMVAIGDRDSGEVHSWDRGQKGDGYSWCGITGTVAIGDRDSAEGLGQQARVLWFYRTRMLQFRELMWKGCNGK